MAMACPGANTDGITSHLPPEIIGEILSRLPMLDAVRTSILSRIWRYKWISMPDLNFKDNRKLQYTNKLVKAISPCLHLHQGPIRKFSFFGNSSIPDIDRWISLLSSRSVEQLHFWFCFPEVIFPSGLFTCKKLTHLTLYFCKLDIPPKFEGFMNLKSLTLKYVQLMTGNIEMIVSTSPLLESLIILLIPKSKVEVITISAPKLNYLVLQHYPIEGKQVITISTPKLNQLKVHHPFINIFLKNVIPENGVMDDDHTDCSNLIKLLRGTEDYFIKMGTPETRFHHLKVMDLTCVRFEDRKAVLHILKMLTSAPNLEKLSIHLNPVFATWARVVSDFWPEEHPQGRAFMKLKVFQMKGISGVADEIEFAKIILCNSPVLEEMVVKYFEWMQQEKEDYMQTLRAFITRATVALSCELV